MTLDVQNDIHETTSRIIFEFVFVNQNIVGNFNKKTSLCKLLNFFTVTVANCMTG